MKLPDVLRTLLEEMHKISRTESVVGRPIEVGKTHVVPVCNLSLGFGTGGGLGSGQAAARRASGGGSGAGGGIAITPVAFVVVDPEGKAHLQSLRHRRASALTKAIDLIPRLTDHFLSDLHDGDAVGEPDADKVTG